MLTRIEVGQKSPSTDSQARKILATLHETFRFSAEKVAKAATLSVYTLEMELDGTAKERIARDLFTDPITEKFAIDAHLATGSPGAAGSLGTAGFDFLIEVGYKPGVTDNVGRSSREGISDLLGRTLSDDDQVFTGRQFQFWGALTRADAETIATKLLANPLIETYLILSKEEWRKSPAIPKTSGKVTFKHKPEVRTIELPESDEALQKLSDEKVLALTIAEMRAIKAYYAAAETVAHRTKAGLPASPTDVELEVLAQTWSEHCKHKIFAADIEYTDETGKRENISSLYKTYIKAATEKVRPKAPWLKSVFTDNAGIIAFTEDWDVSMKAETHNSPSALDPYGGAMTGIVGVNRDILGSGMGSRPIFNTDVFCFASPFYDKPIPEKLHHPRRIFKEVHRGVKDGGNESGIPTVNGSIVFDDRFLGKPLVFCGTGGLHPSTVNGKPSWQKTIEPGDRILMAGGRIGKDGIHGATFSSAALTEASPTSAVQIGDPITQKKLSDFLLEARDQGLYRFVTDNGAGGLSSSLGEMARESGGCKMHLEKAPLKYAGLDPWEILVSEAQERMSFAVPPEKLAAFLELARRRGVEASDLGEFSGDGLFEAYFQGSLACSLSMEFLHEGNPKLKLKARWAPPRHSEPPVNFWASRDLKADALTLLSALNICSKESWVRQYDHEVQGMSVIKPFVGEKADGPSDAAVVRPLYDRKEGLVVSHGIVPRYSDIDCYHMTACALDEAVRNAVAVGARPGTLAGLDNFCWPDPVESENTPDGQLKLAHLVRSNQALYDYCVAYGLPLISGKDSMKNDYGRGKDKISVPPTLLFTVIGKIDDVEKTITMDAKAAGDRLYALGVTRNELGGSEYFRQLGFTGNAVPKVDAVSALALYHRLADAIEKGLVRSAHDCSDGGLFTAIAEVCMAGRLGATVDLAALPTDASLEALTPGAKLFSESQSRFVITVTPQNCVAFEALFHNGGSGATAIKVPFACIGEVTDRQDLVIRDASPGSAGSGSADPGFLFSAGIDEMFASWRRPLDW
ncbi:MAG: phosphoribosylformylglycinamidine synthase [Fibrobacteres bacterium]|nr:phosphoribosylformylglycinamidine synthase [Fibrobacterota bacterium]